MQSNTFDLCILGAGMAGAMATLKIATEYKDVKTILFDIGSPPQKRKIQMIGWLGCLPSSDGKFYINDLEKISDLIGAKKTNSAYKYFTNYISQLEGDFNIIKDKKIHSSLNKKLNKLKYNVKENDYIQVYPKNIHSLSKLISKDLEECNNIQFHFDDEIIKISKQKNMFILNTEDKEFKCKKIILAVGRSGWRFARDVFSNFGIIENNDLAKFGIRAELSSDYMKDFNEAHCSLFKDDIEIGPFSWNGTVIPEDHFDMAISAFRSNENRWLSDKVSFSIIGNKSFPNKGAEETDRLAKLTFVLTNDRVAKDKISNLMADKSIISIIPEYNWLKETIEEVNKFIPDLKNKGYFHIPTIVPLMPNINIGNNLETDIEGLFVAGETANVSGLLAAACTGLAAADSACKA